MVHFITDPKVDLPQPSMLGTKVTLAGRPMCLPNRSNPILVQKLTLRQIAAIPRDKYAVAIIEPNAPSGVLHTGPMGHGSSFASKKLRYYRNAIQRRFHGRNNKSSASTNGTQEYTAVIALLQKVQHHVETIYYDNRELSRNKADGPPSESALFYDPIDEGRLSDCFMKIIADYFGVGDKCKLYGHDFKLHEFCLFVHYYFRRIGIMKTNARQPFSEYVRNSVLKDEAAFTDKTFNNFAKLYEDKEKEFTDKKMHEINFAFRPSKDAKSDKPLQQLLYAFQDIGYNFHNSDYFKYLREARKRMNEFYL